MLSDTNEMVSRSRRADFIAYIALIATSARNYTHRVAVETAQRIMLAMPVAGDGASPIEEGLHSVCLDLQDLPLVTQGVAKSFQDVLSGLETLSKCFPAGRRLSDYLMQFHHKPAKSKSAPSLNPAMSTLA